MNPCIPDDELLYWKRPQDETVFGFFGAGLE
jgi:hypothetical protein